MNRLYFGDNFDWLQRIEQNSIDLVYLDPPFNSKAQYNLLYETPNNLRETAQKTVFRDTWSWETEAQFCFDQCIAFGGRIAPLMRALKASLKTSDTMAYLAMMAARLVLIHRVLKPSGSLYLHCDPVASHYLKIILDAIFGPTNFRTEINWRRTSSHNDAKQGRRQYGNVRDIILFYTTTNEWTWNQQYTPYKETYLEEEYRHRSKDGAYKETDVTAAKPGGDTLYHWRVKRSSDRKSRWVPDFEEEFLNPKPGWEYMAVSPYRGRFWAYSRDNLRKFWEEGALIHRSTGMPRLMQFADDMPGVPLQNDWQDIPPAPRSEALGYPTQKPLALLRRIIETSSNPGDTILDPFCGCGTSVHAAAELNRTWIGIDVSYYAVRLIRRRLKARFGTSYDVPIDGIPADLVSAEALAEGDPYGFQQWAVHELGCQLWGDGRRGADGGIDGEMWFFNGPGREAGRLLVQVKGGKKPTVAQVREFKAVMDYEIADMGIFFCRGDTTSEMRSFSASVGFHRIGNRSIPRLQLVTLGAWYQGQRPDLPSPIEITIPKDKSIRSKKPARRPDPRQPEFFFGIEGKEKELSTGQVLNPDMLSDDAFEVEQIA